VCFKVFCLFHYTATTGFRLPPSIRTISSEIMTSEIIRKLTVNMDLNCIFGVNIITEIWEVKHQYSCAPHLLSREIFFKRPGRVRQP